MFWIVLVIAVVVLLVVFALIDLRRRRRGQPYAIDRIDRDAETDDGEHHLHDPGPGRGHGPFAP